MPEQVQLFNEHIEQLKRDEKAQRVKGKTDKLAADFDALLAAKVPDATLPWSAAKRLVASDPRFAAVASEIEREDLYRLHTARRLGASAAPSVATDSRARAEVPPRANTHGLGRLKKNLTAQPVWLVDWLTGKPAAARGRSAPGAG